MLTQKDFVFAFTITKLSKERSESEFLVSCIYLLLISDFVKHRLLLQAPENCKNYTKNTFLCFGMWKHPSENFNCILANTVIWINHCVESYQYSLSWFLVFVSWKLTVFYTISCLDEDFKRLKLFSSYWKVKIYSSVKETKFQQPIYWFVPSHNNVAKFLFVKMSNPDGSDTITGVIYRTTPISNCGLIYMSSCKMFKNSKIGTGLLKLMKKTQ